MEDKRTLFGIPNEKDSGWVRSKVLSNPPIDYARIEHVNEGKLEETPKELRNTIEEAFSNIGLSLGKKIILILETQLQSSMHLLYLIHYDHILIPSLSYIQRALPLPLFHYYHIYREHSPYPYSIIIILFNYFCILDDCNIRSIQLSENKFYLIMTLPLPNNATMEDNRLLMKKLHNMVGNIDGGLFKVNSKFTSKGGSAIYHCGCRGDNIKTPTSSYSTTLKLMDNPSNHRQFWRGVDKWWPSDNIQTVLYSIEGGSR